MIKIQYNLLKLRPFNARGEIINVGLISIWNNQIYYLILQNDKKIRSITNQTTIFDLENFIFNLKSIFQITNDYSGLKNLYDGSTLYLSEPGYFVLEYKSEDLFHSRLNELFNKWVEAPRKQRSTSISRQYLNKEIKQHFSEYGLLSSNPDEINNHKVIVNFPISENKGLKADFLLKNGAYHMTEIINFSKNYDFTINLQKAALKSVTIEEAKHQFIDLNAFVIYDLTLEDEKKFQPQLNLIKDHADLVNFQSIEAKSNYFEYILSKAGYQNLN